jgi:hypothetical protein
VVILTNPLVVAYYSFMSIGELEMGFTDAELINNFSYFIYLCRYSLLLINLKQVIYFDKRVQYEKTVAFLFILFSLLQSSTIIGQDLLKKYRFEHLKSGLFIR